VLVVKKALETAGNLLARSVDQGSDVSGLQVSVAVDEVQDFVVAGGEGEVAVSFGVTIRLWRIPTEPS
jgi:hypothetical protein